MWFSSLCGSRLARCKSARKRKAGYRPRFELLEDRIIPATRIWDGGALGNNTWSNRFNWAGDVAPVSGDDLVFPEAAAQKTNVNNLINVPGFQPFTFASLTFTGGGYDISGTGIRLVPGSLLAPSINSNAAVGAINNVDLDIGFNVGSTAVFQTVATAAGNTLNLSGNLTGNAFLVKAGAGTLELSGVNSHTQTTFVAQGILRAASNAALGSTAAGTEVSSGATLEVDGASVNDALLLNGSGVGGAGALHGISGNAFLGGNVTLSSGATIGVDAGAQLNLAGIVSGSGDLTKIGYGKLALNRANTYTGQTFVNDGAVIVHHAQALGSTSAGTRVLNGAAVVLEEFLPLGGEFPNILNVAESLTLSGSGIGGTGSLRNVSGDNTWSGAVTLAGATTIGVDAEAGPFLPDQLTISGVIGDVSPRFSNEISKVGDGRLILTRLNTYKGVTSINDGVVQIQQPRALGSTLGFTQVASGAALEMAASLHGSGALLPINVFDETLRLNGSGEGGAGALRNVSQNNSWSGPVIMESDSVIGVDGANTLTINGVVSGAANMRKVGDGTLTLTAGNVYTGATSVTNGIVRVLGGQPTSSVLVTLGAELEGTGTVGALLVENGVVNPGTGGGLGGTLSVDGNLTLNSAATYQTDFHTTGPAIINGQLKVNGTVTINNAALQQFGPGGAVLDEFIIIDNDGTDPVIGRFAGLANNGDRITGSSGETFEIFYNAGDGNDVMLRHVNTKPTFINRSVTSPISEGQTVTLNGTIIDPDPLDTFFLTVNWGDGIVKTFEFGPGADGTTVNITHTYEDENEDDRYVIRLAWSDDHEFSNSAELAVVVHNVAPEVDAGEAAVVREGSQFVHRGKFTDPGADTWTATVDYGDGSGERPLELRHDETFKLKHRYDEPGRYLVTVTVRDDDGGVGTDSFWVLVLPRGSQSNRAAVDAFFAWLADWADKND